MASFRLHPQAQKELDEDRARLLRLVGSRIITAAQAQRIQLEFVRKLFAQAWTDTGSTYTPYRCNSCGKVHVIPEGVTHYKCTCSPHTERTIFRSSRIDLPIGTSPIEHQIAAAGGRTTIA